MGQANILKVTFILSGLAVLEFADKIPYLMQPVEDNDETRLWDTTKSKFISNTEASTTVKRLLILNC